MLIHQYLAFWRPDIFEQLKAGGSPIVALCDFVGNGESVTTDTRNVTCPVCRDNFLNAMPTGDGSKRTWAEYLASPQAAPRVTLAQRAAEADAKEAQWSTAPKPPAAPAPWAAPDDGWSTKPPADIVGGWTSSGGGWSTKR